MWRMSQVRTNPPLFFPELTWLILMLCILACDWIVSIQISHRVRFPIRCSPLYAHYTLATFHHWCWLGAKRVQYPKSCLLKCCVASVVAQSIVLYRTCTVQPAVWGFVSLGLTHCDRVFIFQMFTCNTVGGPWWVWSLFRSVAGQLFPSILWCCWLRLLTCKTVSRITYTVLVETLNPAQSNPIRVTLIKIANTPLDRSAALDLTVINWTYCNCLAFAKSG